MAQPMEPTTVIRRPIVTEKATASSDVANTYSFEVDRRATKTQIKHAIQALFHVRVVAVRTANRKGEHRGFKYGVVQLPTVKRAFVRVHSEDKIELI
ncbi:MAG: 50S ribosomal protein L23 [Planctomycetota bacterium]|nr:50S ribosomal protein L23 [Planctomycetota bacterium]MDA1105248.1 50S ribosomal protein L23 [Planctomycetota bacterium]